MGEPVRIVDLARDMIRLSDSARRHQMRSPACRPGEKLYEEPLSIARARLAPRPETTHRQSGRLARRGWLAELEAWISQPRVRAMTRSKRLAGEFPSTRHHRQLEEAQEKG